MQRVAGRLEANACLLFREQILVDSALAGVVDQVGDAGKAGVEAGEVEVVVDLVKQVAQGGGVAIAGANETRELGRQLLFDGFFKDGAAEAGASGEEPIKKAAGGFVKVAIGFIGAGRGDDAFAQLRGARDGGFDELEKFEGEGGAEEVILLGIEGTLNLLPDRRGSVGVLDAG